MFDARIVPHLRKPLDLIASGLQRFNITPNQVTVIGFLIGLLAVPAIAMGHFELGLGCILINRIADGVDGALARRVGITDAGGYLDISLDFIFYSAVPFAFLLHAPEANAIAAGVLMLTFMGTAATFLGFAIQAEKRGISNPRYPNKSLHYMGGITEGSESIAVFVLFCLWPEYFSAIAYVFAALCWVTALTRLWAGYQTLRQR